MQDFRNFVQWAVSRPSADRISQCPRQAVIVANGALLLLDAACYFLDRQLARLAVDFESGGGFSERMRRHRLKTRENLPG